MNVGGFLAPLICGTLGETFGWHYGFGAAGVGMLVGLVIYFPVSVTCPRERASIVEPESGRARSRRDTFMLLLAVGLAVTVFRGAYEQMGNTVALWIESVDRQFGDFEIAMTCFQSLNPLLVIAMTPVLLVCWRRKAECGPNIHRSRRWRSER